MEASRAPTSARAVPLFFFLVVVLTLAGFLARDWLPPVASEHGPGIDRTIVYLMLVTGAVFVLGHIVLGAFVWRFSGDGPSTYKPVSPKVEWAWALVPVLVMALTAEVGVLVMSGPVWAKVYGEPPPDAVQVEVVGRQFEWFIRYPGKDGKFGTTRPELVDDVENPLGLDPKDPAAKDDIVRRGALRLPLGKTAVVRLRSYDVLHSFSVPELRVKQDLVPGLTDRTQFRPVRAGKYEIACAELCGLGHYKMRGTLTVETPEEHEKWLREQRGSFE